MNFISISILNAALFAILNAHGTPNLNPVAEDFISRGDRSYTFNRQSPSKRFLYEFESGTLLDFNSLKILSSDKPKGPYLNAPVYSAATVWIEDDQNPKLYVFGRESSRKNVGVRIINLASGLPLVSDYFPDIGEVSMLLDTQYSSIQKMVFACAPEGVYRARYDLANSTAPKNAYVFKRFISAEARFVSCAFSPNADQIAILAEDSSVKIFDTTTGDLIRIGQVSTTKRRIYYKVQNLQPKLPAMKWLQNDSLFIAYWTNDLQVAYDFGFWRNNRFETKNASIITNPIISFAMNSSRDTLAISGIDSICDGQNCTLRGRLETWNANTFTKIANNNQILFRMEFANENTLIGDHPTLEENLMFAFDVSLTNARRFSLLREIGDCQHKFAYSPFVRSDMSIWVSGSSARSICKSGPYFYRAYQL